MYNDTTDPNLSKTKPRKRGFLLVVIFLLLILLIGSGFGFYYLYTNKGERTLETTQESNETSNEDALQTELETYSDPDFSLFFRYSKDLTVNAGNLVQTTPADEEETEEVAPNLLSKTIEVTDKDGNKLIISYANSIECDKPYSVSEIKQGGKLIGDFAFAEGKIYLYKNKYILITTTNEVEDVCSDKVITNVKAELVLVTENVNTSDFDNLVLTIDDATYSS